MLQPQQRLSQSHWNLTILHICSKLGQGGSDFISQDLPTLGCRSPPGKGHNLKRKQFPLWQFPCWNSAVNHGSQFPRPQGKCISSSLASSWWLEAVAPANTVTSSLASCYPGARILKLLRDVMDISFIETLLVFPDGNMSFWEPWLLNLWSPELWEWETEIPQVGHWRDAKRGTFHFHPQVFYFLWSQHEVLAVDIECLLHPGGWPHPCTLPSQSGCHSYAFERPFSCSLWLQLPGGYVRAGGTICGGNSGAHGHGCIASLPLL